MNSNREDYLKIIYEEGGLERPVPNKIIAQRLQVAPGSVSEMLTKLSKAGLVDAISHKGVQLTSEGLSICFNLIRSHRLWEVFLMRHLHYSWREAHEEAHLLEHIATEKMIDRLDLFLNFPSVCPHGEHIPRKGEHLEAEPQLDSLSQLEAGDRAIVSRLIEDGELLDYLEGVGLCIGATVCITEKQPYEGGISFTQEAATLCISHKASTQIFVERI